MIIKRFPDKAQFRKLAEKNNVIPVCVEILADTETPVSLLKKIYKNKGPVFLFESVEGGERWGRYSFLSGSARYHIRVYTHFVEIEEKDGSVKQIIHNGDPLSVLRDFMSRFIPADIQGLPRFWGGMVGYLSYEAVSFFEAVPNKWPEEKPLACFMVPDQLLVFDNIHNTLLIIDITFLDKDIDYDIDAAFESANIRIESMLQTIGRPLPENDYNKAQAEYKLIPLCDADIYRSNVKRIIEYIRAGDVIQTVISQPFVCESSPDLWALYRAQRYINPSRKTGSLQMNCFAMKKNGQNI
jgi:anthranilate synthase component 1